MIRRAAVVCLSLGILSVLGCTGRHFERAVSLTPQEKVAEVLLPVAALRGDLVLQQRVTIRWGDNEQSFDAVLQKRGDELLLLGLGPMNRVGFVLTLDDGGVHFENRSGRDLAFEPERILADVQRVFYPWITSEPPCVDCERYVTRPGLAISERIGSAYLEERRFEDLGESKRGTIIVRYDDWMDRGSIPGRAVLTNDWYGYELRIVTKSIERLD